MDFDPIAFKNLSSDLYDGPNQYVNSDSQINQALLRTIASRVYYSILLKIKKMYNINTEGISDSHRAIIESLTDKHTRNLLHDMKDIREQADYELNKNIASHDIEDQFDLFERIFSNIN